MARPESAGSANGEAAATSPPPIPPPPSAAPHMSGDRQPGSRRSAVTTPPDGMSRPVPPGPEPGPRPAHLSSAPNPGPAPTTPTPPAPSRSGGPPPLDSTLVGEPGPPPDGGPPYGAIGGRPFPGPKLGRNLLRGRLPTRSRRRGLRGRTDGAQATEGKWVTHRIRHVHPWSVVKVAALFYVCVFLTFMVAGFLLWNVGRSTETIDQLEGFVTDMGAYGRCVPEDSIEPGTDFERSDDCPDGRVQVGGFRIDDGAVFRTALFGGIVLVIAGTAGTVLLTLLFNLLTEVTGGVRYTTVREQVRPPTRSPDPQIRR